MITISGLGDDTAPPVPVMTVTSDASDASTPPVVPSTSTAPVAVSMTAGDSFLLANPTPTSSDVATYLKTCPAGPQRDAAAQELILKGVPQQTVSAALHWLATTDRYSVSKNQIFGWLSILSGALGAFHGYRRNKSVGWAIAWFAAGTIFPIFTPVLALSQGFGQPKKAA